MHLNFKLPLLLTFFLLPVCCLAQFTISGRVLNQADTKPVPDVSVFLSNTATGTKTGANGAFTLRNVTPGKYQLVITVVGYEGFNREINVGSADISLPDITIFPKTIGLKEVTVRVDHNRDKNFALYYERFKNEFLGATEFAKDCKILNPEVLDLSYNDVNNQIIASSQGFLQIDNKALGYKLSYQLTNFTQSNATHEIHYEGAVLFTEMKGTPAQERSWQQNRALIYNGSLMHFLRSALDDQLADDGFRVLKLTLNNTPGRPADSIINTKIKQFETVHNNDSAAYWKRKLKLPATFTTLTTTPLRSADIVNTTAQPGIFALLGGSTQLLVSYDKNHHFTDVSQLADSRNLNYILSKVNNKEISVLSATVPYVFFDSNGRVIDPNSVQFTGKWSVNRVANLLPLNYEATQGKTAHADSVLKNIENKLSTFSASHITEKVYLHTDRPYYGLGDTIWFKAYTVAGSKHQPSNLSGVLYADLVSDADTVLQRINLQLNDGIASGDFAIPYTYKSGAYSLRAYTNLMLNDSTNFYNQRLIIGGLKSVPDAEPAKAAAKILPGKIAAQVIARPDVQFFPEGGELVVGLRSRVAVKVVDANGAGRDAQGVITDNSGNEVAEFATQHAGMGQFAIIPLAGTAYKAKVTFGDGSSHTVALPGAVNSGFTLAVNAIGDSLLVKVAANEAQYKQSQNTSFYLVAQSGGITYFTASDKLAGPVFTAAIDKARFPSGITQFTLFSQSGEPLCERLVFIQTDDQLKLDVSASKTTYAAKEPITLNINAKNADGSMVKGSFSAAVTDETQVPVDENAEHTIFTDLLLTSDLKGTIENPNYYFANSTAKTKTDLDLLMLTQGYRKFAWKRILAGDNRKRAYQPENSLSLSGTIKTMGNKPVPFGRIRITAIANRFSVDTVSDANGNFVFNDINLPDTTKVIINAKKANGGNNVKITINRPKSAPVGQADDKITSADMPEAVLTALKKSYVAGQQAYLKNVIQLKEVAVNSRRNNYFNPKVTDNLKLSANLNQPGHADQIILADKLTGCATLSECLRSVVFEVEFSNTMPSLPYSRRAPTRLSGGRQPMAVIIDGLQVSPNELDDINPDDVYSVEVLISGGNLAIYGSNAANGALIITIKHGSDYNPALETVDGLITYKFNGYYKAREFYSPKYNAANMQVADQRRTIYWKPDILTGADGKSTLEYFNADGKGSYRVVVEGIDENGNLGRQVFRYKVE